jgi:hypothetical protein
MTDQWQPVDLSSLDPARRPEWPARVAATSRALAAIVERRAVSPGTLDIVGGWARPILAAAAVLLILLGGAGALLDGSSTPSHADLDEARRIALLSEASLAHGRTPTGAELRHLLLEPAR